MSRVNTKAEAQFWGVALRTVQNWIKNGEPVRDRLLMARSILNMRSPAKSALAKASDLLLKWEGRLPGGAEPPGGDRFETATLPEKESGISLDDVDENIDTQKIMVFCWAKAEEAARLKSQVDFDYWQKRALLTAKSIREDEAHARKMGLDEGDLISREEFARLCHALAFWMLRSVDIDIQSLAPKLLDLQFVEEARGALDRFFLRSRFLSPWQKATTYPSQVSLPAWAYQYFTAAAAAYWETDPADPDDVAAWDAFQAALSPAEPSSTSADEKKRA